SASPCLTAASPVATVPSPPPPPFLPRTTTSTTASTTTPPTIPPISATGGFFFACACCPGIPRPGCDAPAISSAVVGLSPPFGVPSSLFSGGGLNFSPGAQKRNLRWPSSSVSPGLMLETAYSSPLTRTPLALLLSITFHCPPSSTNFACWRETDW